MNKQQQEYSTLKLIPHPFNTQIYGSETLKEDFLKSVERNRILTPVDIALTTINGVEGFYILSGHTRVAAAKELKMPTVPVTIHEDKGVLWQQNLILEANQYREKTTEQKAREYEQRVRIEKALAETRRLAGIRVIGTASERAAIAVGLPDNVARQMAVVIQKADAGDEIAKEGLQKINEGIVTPSFVYNQVQPREADPVLADYDAIARKLETVNGFFKVLYSPRSTDPMHGFLFQRRFACQEEAEAFLELIAAIPEEARHKFARLSDSWRK